MHYEKLGKDVDAIHKKKEEVLGYIPSQAMSSENLGNP